MSKRTVLKILAFIVGLYFFLEYILPEKVGGDFDCYEVRSPVTAAIDGQQLLFYVGQYRKEAGAVGRMVPATGFSARWRREPDTPVMQRSLFMSYDRWGMEQLDAVAAGTNLYLLYLGKNPEQKKILCYAVSHDDGITWKKHGPVIMATNDIPVPSAAQPNGQLPCSFSFYAADYISNTWILHLVFSSKTKGKTVHRATGTSLQNLRVSAQPVIRDGITLDYLEAFDTCIMNGTSRFTFVQTNSIMNGIAGPGAAYIPVSREYIPTNTGLVVSLRNDPVSSDYYIGTEELRNGNGGTATEQSSTSTRLYAIPPAGAAAAALIKTVGRPAYPTYLSRGTEWAGQFMQIVGSFAIFIAMINLVIFHGRKIIQWRSSPQNSIIFLVFLAMMAPLAFFGTPEAAEGTWTRLGFDFLFNSVQLPMGAAVFSMITFYMISAAYRSFKIKSAEAALLMLSAIIVMVGQMPVGEWLTMPVPDTIPVLQMPWLAQKLLSVFNAAAYRGVLIGMLIGGLSITLRIWLGIDNSVYASLDKGK